MPCATTASPSSCARGSSISSDPPSGSHVHKSNAAQAALRVPDLWGRLFDGDPAGAAHGQQACWWRRRRGTQWGRGRWPRTRHQRRPRRGPPRVHPPGAPGIQGRGAAGARCVRARSKGVQCMRLCDVGGVWGPQKEEARRMPPAPARGPARRGGGGAPPVSRSYSMPMARLGTGATASPHRGRSGGGGHGPVPDSGPSWMRVAQASSAAARQSDMMTHRSKPPAYNDDDDDDDDEDEQERLRTKGHARAVAAGAAQPHGLVTTSSAAQSRMKDLGPKCGSRTLFRPPSAPALTRQGAGMGPVWRSGRRRRGGPRFRGTAKAVSPPPSSARAAPPRLRKGVSSARQLGPHGRRPI
jgi:hypothetical protein